MPAAVASSMRILNFICTVVVATRARTLFSAQARKAQLIFVLPRVGLHHGDRGEGLLDEVVESAFDLLLLIPALQHRLRVSAKHHDHERQNREGEQRQRAVHPPHDRKHRTQGEHRC